MTAWRIDDTIGLVARAYGWFALVTVPVVSVTVACWTATVSAVVDGWRGGLEEVLSAVLLFDVVTAVAALGGAVVSLPFTRVLGVLLVDVRSPRLQVVATTVLAGGLGCVTAWIAGEAVLPPSGPLLALFVGVSAAGAGALARWGQLRSDTRQRPGVSPTVVWP